MTNREYVSIKDDIKRNFTHSQAACLTRLLVHVDKVEKENEAFRKHIVLLDEKVDLSKKNSDLKIATLALKTATAGVEIDASDFTKGVIEEKEDKE